MEKEYTRVAKNGINIHSYRNPHVHSFHISLTVKAGCMYESEDENGITHFLEHVLYRNVNMLMGGKLYSILDEYNIELGAATYNEMMQFNVSSSAKNFKIAAQILSKVLMPITLGAGDFKAELSRIKAEIRESDDRTSLSAFTSGIVHEGTGLSRTILGTLGGISRVSRGRLEEYRRRIFTSDNLFVYLTGRYGDDELDYLSDLLGEAMLNEGEKHENNAPVSQKFGKREPKLHIKNADFTMLRFSFDMDMSQLNPGEDDLIYDILLGGNNSRFYIEMSEKRGLFYDISGSVEKYRNIGTFSFTYEVRVGSVYEAVGLSLSILKEMKTELLSERECMKTQYVDGGELLLDDVRELNYTFAYDAHVMCYPYRSVSERANAYSLITPERLREVANIIFRPENLSLTMKGNKKKIDSKAIEQMITDF